MLPMLPITVDKTQDGTRTLDQPEKNDKSQKTKAAKDTSHRGGGIVQGSGPRDRRKRAHGIAARRRNGPTDYNLGRHDNDPKHDTC